MPQVSVAIPSYNHEKYIADAIRSVLDQTYQDFEIVITDDGSSDRTVDVIKTIKDPRIRLFRFKENQGACAAMNNNIREAKGEYIAVLNSDDLYLTRKLEKQVAFLEQNPDIGSVFSYPQLIDEAGHDYKGSFHLYQVAFNQNNRTRFEWLNHFFHHTNALCHPTVLLRKECYDKVGFYDERFAQMPDFDMWIRLCMEYEIFIMQEPLIKFRIHSSEVNASGGRPDANARLMIEHAYILKNYLNIKTKEHFYKIFPEGRRFEHCFDERLIPFFIAMLAIDRDLPASKHFAVYTLFDLLRDEETRKRLADKCGFSMRDFINITGKHDLFKWDAIQKLAAKEREIAAMNERVYALEQELHSIHEKLQSRQQELDRIESSRGWKLFKKYMRN